MVLHLMVEVRTDHKCHHTKLETNLELLSTITSNSHIKIYTPQYGYQYSTLRRQNILSKHFRDNHNVMIAPLMNVYSPLCSMMWSKLTTYSHYRMYEMIYHI